MHLFGLTPIGLLFLFILTISTIVYLFALIDIFKSNFLGKNDKLIWATIVIFTGIFGAIIYFFIGKTQKINGK